MIRIKTDGKEQKFENWTEGMNYLRARLSGEIIINEKNGVEYEWHNAEQMIQGAMICKETITITNDFTGTTYEIISE